MTLDPLAFAPTGARGRTVQQAMSRRLGRSLRHVHERAREAAGLPAGELTTLLAELAAGRRVRPELFALHGDLLQAAAAGDHQGLCRLFGELAGRSWLGGALEVRAFGDPAFPPVRLERDRRYAASDPDIPLALVAPRDDEFSAFRERVQQALALIEGSAPELAAELQALVGEIVAATVDSEDPDRTFDGISVFELWGALFVNPRRHPTRLETAEVLVHEAAHTLLFAHCLDEPLVLNPTSERHASPVRRDPRPMDGVFHGTYVIAILHYFQSRLIASGLLSADEAQSLDERLRSYPGSFSAGLRVIQDKAVLTDTGRRVIDSAAAYMASASG